MATRSLAAACDILFGEAGLPFRATKDFDIVLCVEVVTVEFGTVFADFLEAGGYRARERSTGRREFYRFHRPADETFPAMIELFARRPDTLKLPNGAELSPIPVEEDVISLSAILLDDDYFEALQKARRVIDDISLIDETILIPLKAHAFLDLSERKANGEDGGGGSSALDAWAFRCGARPCGSGGVCGRSRVGSGPSPGGSPKLWPVLVWPRRCGIFDDTATNPDFSPRSWSARCCWAGREGKPRNPMLGIGQAA